jgi:hypothetical protein
MNIGSARNVLMIVLNKTYYLLHISYGKSGITINGIMVIVIELVILCMKQYYQIVMIYFNE